MNSHSYLPEANEKPSAAPSREQVSVAAYHLYLESGREDGRDWEHWFRAEQLLKESAALAGRTSTEEAARPQPATLSHARNGSATPRRPEMTTRDEVRRRSIPPAARQSLRQRERSGQMR